MIHEVAYHRQMRQKRPRPAMQPMSEPEPFHVDLGASARQIGRFETANGLPSEIWAIVVAFLVALLMFPIRALRRRLVGSDRPHA